MGGKSKKSISALEKQQKLREVKEKKVKEKDKEERKEKKLASPLLPLEVAKQLENELNAMKCITPHALATRFGLKMGVAKSVLRELEQRGVVRCVARSSRLPIYTPVNVASG